MPEKGWIANRWTAKNLSVTSTHCTVCEYACEVWVTCLTDKTMCHSCNRVPLYSSTRVNPAIAQASIYVHDPFESLLVVIKMDNAYA